MVPNAPFWAHYCRQVHVRAIEAFRVGALEKVVPAFRGIAEEAETAAEEEFDRLGSMPADPDGAYDMGEVAEWANEHGIAYYETMWGVRQSVLNLLAVGLHHVLEQQQLFFLGREFVTGDGGSPKPSDLERRLAECGVECRRFKCAGKLYELKMAANAIKHGAGPAAEKLAKLRPDLFQFPDEGDRLKAGESDPAPADAFVSPLFAPLTGSDLYVTERDLAEWYAAAIGYWEELSAILDDQQQPQGTE